MARPTKRIFDVHALRHNLQVIKTIAPHQTVMAMVKANAYGCGFSNVIPELEGSVEAFGVASIEEAIAIRRLGSQTNCVLLEGVFHPEEYQLASQRHFSCVIHHTQQLEWLLGTSLQKHIQVWIKVNTGMHRLGFLPEEVSHVYDMLQACPWVEPIGVMTHFACADEPNHPENALQLQRFKQISHLTPKPCYSLANSAAIISLPESHADMIRPGIMLYGISPFANKIGADLGLQPVLRLVSEITAIHVLAPHSAVGYGGTWSSDKEAVVGIIPIGYADGYPRAIEKNTPVWVNGSIVPIIGRVSMDMITVDLTMIDHPKIGDPVELWGQHVPVERIAQSANTIAYELMTKINSRVPNALGMDTSKS